MTTSTTGQALQESLLAAGRNPLLQTTPIDCTVAPSYLSAGYDVTAYSRAALQVQLGRGAPYRRWVFTAPTFDAASTYVIAIGATSNTEATPADEATLWGNMATDLAAALPSTYTVEGAETSLTITGPAALGSFTATGGAPALAMQADYTSGRVRLYGRRSEVRYGTRISDADQLATAQGWALLPGRDWLIGMGGLYVDAVCCGATDSLRPWVTDLAGQPGDACSPGAITYTTPTALVLPCVLDGT